MNESSGEEENYVVLELSGGLEDFDPKVIQEEERKSHVLPLERVYDVVNKANAFREVRNGSMIIPSDILAALSLCGICVLDGKNNLKPE